jgi:hypothetical protein
MGVPDPGGKGFIYGWHAGSPVDESWGLCGSPVRRGGIAYGTPGVSKEVFKITCAYSGEEWAGMGDMEVEEG